MKKSKRYNIVIVAMVLLLIIPQTRKPIQVWLNKAVTLFVKPKPIDIDERKTLTSYNWRLKAINDEDFNFENAKDKVVVLNFWATWCPPCIAEMPSLESLYQQYKSNDHVLFLLVSNEDRETLDKFLRQKNYNLPVYQPITQYPSDFNVSSIPRTFVISPKGEIIIDKTGAADWDSDHVKSSIDSMLRAF